METYKSNWERMNQCLTCMVFDKCSDEEWATKEDETGSCLLYVPPKPYKGE